MNNNPCFPSRFYAMRGREGIHPAPRYRLHPRPPVRITSIHARQQPVSGGDTRFIDRDEENCFLVGGSEQASHEENG